MTGVPEGGVAVEVEGLRAGYGRGPLRRTVLHDLDLSFRPGAVSAVVGPNGVGKTTLFRTLLGFLPPTAGAVTMGGMPPRRYRRRHGIAFLPEVTPRPAGWTGRDLLREGCDLQQMSREERRRALDVAVARAGLDEVRLRRRLSRLSGGSVRRVVLAYALLGDPRVVLLDEPFSGLDAEARARFREIVVEIAAGGATVVLASHELGEVARMADAVAVLRDGRLVRTVDDPASAVTLERAVLGDGTVAPGDGR